MVAIKGLDDGAWNILTIDELIGRLVEIRETEGGDITVCTYDSVIADYTDLLCLETVEDDHYINRDGENTPCPKILLI